MEYKHHTHPENFNKSPLIKAECFRLSVNVSVETAILLKHISVVGDRAIQEVQQLAAFSQVQILQKIMGSHFIVKKHIFDTFSPE